MEQTAAACSTVRWCPWLVYLVLTLLPPGRSCIKAAMQMGTQTSKSRSAILAGATVRALASTLLLLGLIGDRRAR